MSDGIREDVAEHLAALANQISDAMEARSDSDDLFVARSVALVEVRNQGGEPISLLWGVIGIDTLTDAIGLTRYAVLTWEEMLRLQVPAPMLPHQG